MHAIRTIILTAALAFTVQAHAGSGVIKCIDQDGRVTLTDTPCGAGAHSEVLIGGSQGDSASADTPAASVERYILPPQQPRRSLVPARRLPAAGGLARDVATLKAARMNLILQDTASHNLRAQRLASLQ